MSSARELHELNLVSSSTLKLRATALLAEGTGEAVFEACVRFHEAARLERKAVEALSPCPPETRLLGSVSPSGHHKNKLIGLIRRMLGIGARRGPDSWPRWS
jgi:hypothetical protein